MCNTQVRAKVYSLFFFTLAGDWWDGARYACAGLGTSDGGVCSRSDCRFKNNNKNLLLFKNAKFPMSV